MTEIVNNDEIKEVENSEGITVSVGADESLLLKESEEQNDEQVAVEEEKEPELISFDSLQLSPLVLQAIKDLGFESPTPIQERAIPVMMSGDDMIGQAQTGTGKTAAFALPILSKLEPENKNIFALVL